MKLIILGKPGSGKGTQSELICKYYKLRHISTGDIFRKIINNKINNVNDNKFNKNDFELYKEIKNIVTSGRLVPDEITNKLVLNEIKKNNPTNDGFLLDGYPRNVNQARWLSNQVNIDGIILLKVDDEIIIKRLSSRRICPKCHWVYNLITSPPKKDGICDYCNVKLIQREDDKEETIKERLKIYNQNIKPIIEYYKKNTEIIDNGKVMKNHKTLFITINGNQNPKDVFKDINVYLKQIQEYIFR